MRWGREHHTIHHTSETDARRGRGVLLFGSVVCAVFFIVAAAGLDADVHYPDTMSAAARQAFLRHHTSLAAVLALDEYFPEEAVYTGTFALSSTERWTFGQYLRDAFCVLLFGETPGPR